MDSAPTRVMIVGAGGMLSGAICDHLSPTDFSLVALTELDLDITDLAKLRAALDEHTPQCVINCAAITNVDDCERKPDLAHRINGDTPGLVASVCNERGIEMIHISTDYVFDGTKGGPYTEDDPVNPINHYGESKLKGELAVAAAAEKHKILRVSMLYGRHRSNYAELVFKCIEAKKPVKAVTDNAGSPTHCPDIVRQIAALIGRPETGVFHSAGAGGCTRLDFAHRIRDLWPAPDFEIIPVTQADFPQMLAKRPRDSRLDCKRLRDLDLLKIKPWQVAIEDYLEDYRSVHR